MEDLIRNGSDGIFDNTEKMRCHSLPWSSGEVKAKGTTAVTKL